MERRAFLATAVTGLVAGCSGSQPTDTTTESSSETTETSTTEAAITDTTATETTTASKDASALVGERFDGEKLSMVVRDVSTTTKIGEFQQAESGNEFVVVRLAVKNTTADEFLNFSGFLQTTLKDAEGYTYDQTIATTGQTLDGGQLVPGEVSRGDIVYEVPKDASGLQLLFDFQAVSFFNLSRVTVNLAESTDSAADLSQSLGVTVHGTGDEVSYGGVTVGVNSVEFTKSISSFATAGDGKEYAIVDITTKNETGEQQQISTLLQMVAKDGTGQSYPLSITAGSQLDRSYDESTPLGNGETRRGKVVYEVEKGVSPLYWAFEFTLWTDGDKTFWKLR